MTEQNTTETVVDLESDAIAALSAEPDDVAATGDDKTVEAGNEPAKTGNEPAQTGSESKKEEVDTTKAELAELRAELARTRAALADSAKAKAAIDEAVVDDPVKFLVDKGFTAEQIYEIAVNGKAKTDPELKAIKNQLAELKKSQAELAQARADQAREAGIAQFKGQVHTELTKHATDFPALLGTYGDDKAELGDVVWDFMLSEYKKSDGKRDLAFLDAAKELEAKTAKLQARLTKKSATGTPAKTPSATKTLTNAAPAPAKAPADTAKLSDEERFEAAVRALQGA